MTTTCNTETKWLLSSFLCAALCGCAAPATEDLIEEFHQTYPLSADGRISLDNVNGNVRISAWDRPEVKLEATKYAKTREQLDALKIEIDGRPDHLKIHTKTPNSKRHDSASVDYTLTVPQSARLDEVSDVNGGVEIEGVRGAVKVSTVNGGIKADGLAANAGLSSVNGAVKAVFASLDAVKSVSVSTVNGGVDLTIPANANADLSAETVNGGISGDISVLKNSPVGKQVKTRLGEGGANIQATTVNGGLWIRLVKPDK
jgi:DUF4097 and DUF4098 domain-containing protein YvlB